MKEYNQEEFGKLSPEALIVLVFGAEWCGPCKIAHKNMIPVLEKFKDKVHFFHVNVDAEKELTTQQGIRSIPSVVILKGGVEKQRFIGVQGTRDYQKAIEKQL